MPMVLPDHPHPSQDRSRSSPPPNRRSREYRTSDMQQYLISEYQPGAPFPRLTSSTMWGYAGRLGRITRMTARSGLCPTFRHEVARLAQVEDDVLRVNTAVHTVEHAAERLGALFELTDGHRVRVERDRIDGLVHHAVSACAIRASAASRRAAHRA